MPKGTVIIDTSSLIVLSKIDQINLLSKLYAHIITTPEIANEFKYSLPDCIQIISVHNLALKKSLGLQLDLREASAIALALEIARINFNSG